MPSHPLVKVFKLKKETEISTPQEQVRGFYRFYSKLHTNESHFAGRHEWGSQRANNNLGARY